MFTESNENLVPLAGQRLVTEAFDQNELKEVCHTPFVTRRVSTVREFAGLILFMELLKFKHDRYLQAGRIGEATIMAISGEHVTQLIVNSSFYNSDVLIKRERGDGTKVKITLTLAN